MLRRGKPTVRVRYGEAQAMLAGDAMQALAFEVLTPGEGVPAALQARLCALLARAAGHAGMAGGQAIDLASVRRPLSEEQLRDIHRRKTGPLLAFQVIDDVLDCTQASDKLGKTAGKDLHSNKPTYVTVMGVQEARDYAFRLRDQALGALARSGLAHAAPLSILADRVVERDN